MPIEKPNKRDPILRFGDGDDASFITQGVSNKDGYYYFKFIPTRQMRWRKQIEDDQFNPIDRTINRVYKKDLCFQLSSDPDFPVWEILCDYYGNENTPAMDEFMKLKTMIQINRHLQKQNKILQAQLNKMIMDAQRRAEDPQGYMHEVMQTTKYMKDAVGQSQQQFFPPQQPPHDEEL